VRTENSSTQNSINKGKDLKGTKYCMQGNQLSTKHDPVALPIVT